MEPHLELSFAKGFNSGYVLACYEPAVIEKVLRNLIPSNGYVMGLASGRKEYIREREEHDLQNLRERGNDFEYDLGR